MLVGSGHAEIPVAPCNHCGCGTGCHSPYDVTVCDVVDGSLGMLSYRDVINLIGVIYSHESAGTYCDYEHAVRCVLSTLMG